MKPLLPILIVVITALAVASVQFAQRASSEHARADAELALRQKQDVRIRELERARADLQRQLMAQNPQTATDGMRPPRPFFGPSAARSVSPEEERGAGMGPRPFMFRGPPNLESPAARNFMRAQARSSVRRMYEDAGRELGLSADQTNKLIDLLTDQQTRGLGEHRDIPTDRAALQKMAQEMVQKNNADIAAIIGDDKLAQWDAYQKTLPERSQVEQMRQQLDSAGVPMTSDQRGQMVAALVDERQALPRPVAAQGATQEEAFAQQNAWQDEYDRAIQSRAKQVLSSEQFDRYREYQEWMTDMRKSVSTQPAARAMR